MRKGINVFDLWTVAMFVLYQLEKVAAPLIFVPYLLGFLFSVFEAFDTAKGWTSKIKFWILKRVLKSEYESAANKARKHVKTGNPGNFVSKDLTGGNEL